MRLKKQGYKQITKSSALKKNPVIVGFMKNKISFVDEEI